MAVDGRSNGVIQSIGEILFFGEFLKLLLVDLMIEPQFIDLGDVIYLYESVENGEALLIVKSAIIPTGKNTNSFDLISRLDLIDVVTKKNGLFAPRNSTGFHIRGRFL